MTNNLNYLIYVSSATNLMTENELGELLVISRRKNQEKNISGMLLYGDGSFIQVLEGTAEDIESTFETIKKDKRHKNLILILDGDLPKRNFPDWTMGYMSVNKEEMKKLEGYVNPAGEDFLTTGSVHPAIMVLKTFADTNKRYFKI